VTSAGMDTGSYQQFAAGYYLRAEGEAYADNLRAAGVPVTAVRYAGIVNDFVMLDALRGTHAADAAIAQAISFISAGLGTD